MRLRNFAYLALLTVAVAPACTDGSGDKDRVTISNDQGDLSTQVTRRNQPVEVEPASAANALVLAPQVDYTLTLVAEVAPPAVDGVALQATSVAFHGNKAIVSYNMAGEARQGAVDVFTFDAENTPNLTSRAIFADTDVSAVAAGDTQVWLATATADETFATPAVLEALGLSADGQLSLEGNHRMPLSSYVATSVCVTGDRVYATSGNTGGVYAFDRQTYEPVAGAALDDARWVASAGSNEVVVVQGTPGRLSVLTAAELFQTAAHPFDGAAIAESKSTVEVLGGKAFVAGGAGGAFVIDIASGAVVGHIPVPVGLPLPATEVVTNAVSVDGSLMFMSNGAAGIYLVQASDDLSKPIAGAAPSFGVAGRLVLGDYSSANHIAYHDGMLFVATGRGGLKIVQVAPNDVPVEPPTGYPYVTDFEFPTGQAGWVFSGDWGFGVNDGNRTSMSGTVFIDNNPNLADQYSHATNNIAMLDVPMVVPSAGAPTLEFWYVMGDLVHPNDAFYVEVENPATGKWDTKRTFTAEYARDDMAFAQIPLASYAGQAVRVRFRQRLGAATGARRFVVDDVRLGELTAPTLNWPFDTSFESTGDRARWALEGGWRFVPGAKGSDQALSINPDGASQAGWHGSTATMLAFLPVPTEGVPTLSFRYQADLTHPNDKIDIDVQVEGETSWHDLTRFTPVTDHDGWTYDETSLNTYAGKSIRVRIAHAFGDSDAPRTFVIDDVRLGDLDGPEVGFPFGAPFETSSDVSAWSLGGAWSVSSDAFTGEGALDANPDGVAQNGFGAGQDVTMRGFVTLPVGEPITATFRYRVALVDPADRAYVDLQSKDDGVWRNIITFKPEHSRSDWSEQEARLDAWAGESVRLRFRVSYAHTDDVRTFVVDDVRVGNLPEARYAWPFRSTFDGAGLAQWAFTGSWTAVDDPTYGPLVDANPTYQAQDEQGAGHVAMMRGFVEVPATGTATLSYAIRADLTDTADRVYVELQSASGGAWDRVRTYDFSLDHPTLGWDEIPLAPWAGEAVRVRVRYDFGASTDPRAVQLDDLCFGPLVLDSYGYPYANSFESEAARSEWNLWGSWGWSGAHGAAAPAVGAVFLDGNPDDALLGGIATQQVATMNGFVTLPTGTAASLGFSYRFDAVDAGDRLEAQIQSSDDSAWTTLVSLRAEHARGTYASLVLPLDGWAGASVRVRFREILGSTQAARVIAVDNVWLGEYAGAVLPYPYAVDFGSAEAAATWSLNGAWAFTGDGWLSSNPDQVPQSGYGIEQSATQDDFIDLTAASIPVLVMDYALTLTHSNDRAYVEVQAEGQSGWTKVRTFIRADSTQSVSTVSLSLAAWSGSKVRLRLRFSYAGTDDVRLFAVRQAMVGEAL